MKQQMIAQLSSRLAALDIPAQYGAGTDISIHENFFNASWGTGSKKIDYEASIFANEAAQTIFMYEKTTETNRGLSFGSDAETSFQSGKTLFRKVKGVRIGPNGQSVEYDLDLGAIPLAAKETAKQFGWKFKTVLKKEKAMYPAGYVPAAPVIQPVPAAQPAPVVQPVPPSPAAPVAQPTQSTHPVSPASAAPVAQPTQPVPPASSAPATFCTGCGAPMTAGSGFCTKCGNPAGAAPAKSAPTITYATPAPSPAQTFAAPQAPVTQKKRGTWWLVTLCVLAGIMALLFALVGVSFMGWLFYLAIVGLNVFLFSQWREKSAVTGVVLLAVSAIALFIAMSLASGSSDHDGVGTASAGSTAAEKSTGTKASTDVNFSKTIPMEGGATLVADIVTKEGKYDVKLTIIVPSTIVPDDFMLGNDGTTFEYEGYTLQDTEFIEAFLCNSDASEFRSNGPLGPSFTGSDTTSAMDAEFDTYFAFSGLTTEKLEELAATYDTIQACRFRATEVGIRDFESETTSDGSWSYTYGYQSEKAFGLHPALWWGVIPWDEILSEAGIS